MFASKTTTKSKTHELQESEKAKPKKKKLAGAVGMPGINLFGDGPPMLKSKRDKIKTQQDVPQEKTGDAPKNDETKSRAPTKKNGGLFGDSDSNTDDDNFDVKETKKPAPKASTTKKTGGVFDDSDDDSDDIFGDSKPKTKEMHNESSKEEGLEKDNEG